MTEGPQATVHQKYDNKAKSKSKSKPNQINGMSKVITCQQVQKQQYIKGMSARPKARVHQMSARPKARVHQMSARPKQQYI